MIGSMLIGEGEQRSNIRFKDVDYFETTINAKDVDYDSEDVVFTCWLHKPNALDFNKVNRSQYGTRKDFKHDVIA